MSQTLIGGGGQKPNTNVPIVDVSKWLGRGGGVSGLIGTMSLNTGFF